MLVVIFGVIGSAAEKIKLQKKGHIEITALNEVLEDMKYALQSAILDKDELKALEKAEKKTKKQEAKAKAKNKDETRKKRIYVLDFDGDIQATEVSALKESITTVLTMAE